VLPRFSVGRIYRVDSYSPGDPRYDKYSNPNRPHLSPSDASVHLIDDLGRRHGMPRVYMREYFASLHEADIRRIVREELAKGGK
jgi:hypothetical protein